MLMCVHERRGKRVKNRKILKNISLFINMYLTFIKLILYHWICRCSCVCVYEKEKVENMKISKNISSFINKYLAFIELILQHWICKHKSEREEYLPSKHISCKSWHSIVWFGWLFHLDLLLLLLSLASHRFWHFSPLFLIRRKTFSQS